MAHSLAHTSITPASSQWDADVARQCAVEGAGPLCPFHPQVLVSFSQSRFEVTEIVFEAAQNRKQPHTNMIRSAVQEEKKSIELFCFFTLLVSFNNCNLTREE